MRRLGDAVDNNAAANNMIQRTRDAWGEPSRWWAVLGMRFGLPRGWWLAQTPSSTASWRSGALRMPWAIQIPKRATPPLPKRQTWVSATGNCWLLPSEPFPFKGKHLRGFEENHPDKRFKLVDGEAFSWYGSRMLHNKRTSRGSSVGGETRRGLSGFATACQAANAKHDALVIKFHHGLTGCQPKFTEGMLAPGLV